ncbi:MAG: hypothetical protein M9894_23285 [Planctomycetes bacterium]|nr:hypothetical protein [Planctomycetota bacterium]
MAEPRARVRCTYCHDGLAGPAAHCASCLAPHHQDCHAAHGRCAAPGCGDPRALVPDPAGRPARPATAARTKPARARRRVALALGALALLLVGAWGAWPAPPPPAPPAPPRVVVAPAPAPVAPAPRPVALVERVARDVALVARDFRLPVTLAEGERLVVEAAGDGYTHVVLDPGRGAAREARFVAEPGDPIEVLAGPGERLRAGPGEAIVLEPAGADVRATLVRLVRRRDG